MGIKKPRHDYGFGFEDPADTHQNLIYYEYSEITFFMGLGWILDWGHKGVLRGPNKHWIGEFAACVFFVGWVSLYRNKFSTASVPGTDSTYVVCFMDIAQPNLRAEPKSDKIQDALHLMKERLVF